MALKDYRKRVRSSSVGSFLIYVGKYRVLHFVKNGVGRARAGIRKALGNRFPDIETLKGSHEGESCIIVGNGPSVSAADLDKICDADLFSFGANRISDIFGQTGWRPDCMCVMDPAFLIGPSYVDTVEHYFSNLRENGVKMAIVTSSLKRRIDSDLASGFVRFVDCEPAMMYSTHLMPFSNDVSIYVSDLGSVTQFSIQLACYMGFKVVYLYGVDNSYKQYLGMDGRFHIDEAIESHFEGMAKMADDYAVKALPKSKFDAYKMRGFADLRKNVIGYKACRDYAANHGVRIVNVTRGGKLDVFERGDFESEIVDGVG